MRPISDQGSTSMNQYQNRGSPYTARQESFYEPGEPRDEEFDVRADFDGTGPRWSELYGVKSDGGRGDDVG